MCNFSDLFSNELNVATSQDLEEDLLRSEWSLKVYNAGFTEKPEYVQVQKDDPHNVILIKSWRTPVFQGEGEENAREEIRSYLKELRPIPAIRQMADMFTLPPMTIGIHVRTGDPDLNDKTVLRHAWMFKPAKLGEFTLAMEKVLEVYPNAHFFLATQDVTIRQTIQSSYRGRIITQPVSDEGRFTVKGMQEALVDLILLSRTCGVIGTCRSQFSVMASEMGGIPLHLCGADNSVKRIDDFVRVITPRPEKLTVKRAQGMKIGFVGLGKLGKPCAEVMAQKHDVIGYDLTPKDPENFQVSHDLKGAVADREIVFVAVQTPHDPLYDGSKPTSHLPAKDFDYSHVKKVIADIDAIATQDQLIVLISTVLPGTIRREIRPLINNARFIYNPYLIAMGTVKWDMVNPEMVIIGTADGSESGDAKILRKFYETMMENNPRYVIGTWDEAECIKIFYNTFISAKLGIVNMIQDVAERNGHINAGFVAKALADSKQRITGPAYMIPGLGDGGPCHGRDLIALKSLSGNLNLGYDIFGAVAETREIQAKNLANRLTSFGTRVIILGRGYKPGFSSDAGSYSVLVGSYAEEHTDVYYDIEPSRDQPYTYLLAHGKLHHNHPFVPGSVIVDPWREIGPVEGCTVIHYGDTRPNLSRP